MPSLAAVELTILYRKRSDGSNSGLPCSTSPRDRFTVVKNLGVPPDAGTCITPPSDPKRIRPSVLQVACRGDGCSQMTTGTPPLTSTRHNLESADQPID